MAVVREPFQISYLPPGQKQPYPTDTKTILPGAGYMAVQVQFPEKVTLRGDPYTSRRREGSRPGQREKSDSNVVTSHDIPQPTPQGSCWSRGGPAGWPQVGEGRGCRLLYPNIACLIIGCKFPVGTADLLS